MEAPEKSPETEIHKRVYAFLQSQFPDIPPQELVFFRHPSIAGFDVESFLHAFADEFQVDMAGFHYPHYALDERLLFDLPRLLWNGIFRRKRLPCRTFDAQHLVVVAEQGRWLDPAG
jgi:hypothetical protein